MAEQKINYSELEIMRTKELKDEFQRRLEHNSELMNRTHGLMSMVLAHIVDESYDLAKESLRDYMEMQKDYPSFKKKGKRLVEHAIGLIQAIKTKRNFPGLHLLPMSKQQDIFNSVIHHFKDLKKTLNRIEIIQKELKVEDLRSTVYVLRAFFYGAFGILVAIFIHQAAEGIFSSFSFLFNEYLTSGINWFFDYFHI